jgi:hypothetical protein
VTLGTHLNGLSSGQLFLYGITVSAAGLLAWSIPLRAFATLNRPGLERDKTPSKKERS